MSCQTNAPAPIIETYSSKRGSNASEQADDEVFRRIALRIESGYARSHGLDEVDGARVVNGGGYGRRRPPSERGYETTVELDASILDGALVIETTKRRDGRTHRRAGVVSAASGCIQWGRDAGIDRVGTGEHNGRWLTVIDWIEGTRTLID